MVPVTSVFADRGPGAALARVVMNAINPTMAFLRFIFIAVIPYVPCC